MTMADPAQGCSFVNGQWLCNLCHRMFTAKGSAVTHIRAVHMNEKKFVCDFCPKRFSKRFNKLMHEKTCKSKPNAVL